MKSTITLIIYSQNRCCLFCILIYFRVIFLIWVPTKFFGKLPVRTFELLGHKTLAQIRPPTPTLHAVTFSNRKLFSIHYAYIMLMEDHDWLLSSAQHFVY